MVITKNNSIYFLYARSFYHSRVPSLFVENERATFRRKKYFVNDLGFRNYLFPYLIDEFGALEKINDNLPKCVVTMDDMLIDNEKGIIHKQPNDRVQQI